MQNIINDLHLHIFHLPLLFFYRKEANGKNYVKYEVIGANNVAVPTHFFKVVVMETTQGDLEMEAYVMPNQPIDNAVPLTSFQVQTIRHVKVESSFISFGF